MSDWIEKDGRKYFEEGYLRLANENSRRRGEENKDLKAKVQRLMRDLDSLCRLCDWQGDIIAALEKAQGKPQEPILASGLAEPAKEPAASPAAPNAPCWASGDEDPIELGD